MDVVIPELITCATAHPAACQGQDFVHAWMMYFNTWMWYFQVMEPVSFMCPVLVTRPRLPAVAVSYTVHNSLFVRALLRLLDGWRRGSTGWSLAEELRQRVRMTLPRPHVSASGVLPRASHAAIPSSSSKHPHRWQRGVGTCTICSAVCCRTRSTHSCSSARGFTKPVVTAAMHGVCREKMLNGRSQSH